MGKVCFVITSRASWVRCKTAVEAVRNHRDLELQLVIAASAVDHLKPELQHSGADFWIRSQVSGGTHSAMVQTTALTMTQIANTLEFLRPNIVVTVADRHETLATAIAASYMNIPLAHIQGGEVTGSIDQKVRYAVTALSDWHFPATNLAGETLKRNGVDPERIYVTGCPSIDIAAQAMQGSSNRNYSPQSIVVLYHPDTTRVDETRNTFNIMEAVTGLSPVVWVLPNSDGGAVDIHNMLGSASKGWTIRDHMLHEHFFDLLMKAIVVVGNSSVGIREASFMGIPVVDIGTRQNNRERGKNVIHVSGGSSREIRDAIEFQSLHGRYDSDPLYGEGNSGYLIAEQLSKIINRVDISVPIA